MGSFDNIPFTTGLDQTRASFQGEFADPTLTSDLNNRIQNEVGGQSDAEKLAFIESVMNRAHARGLQLHQVINDPSYFPQASFRRGIPAADYRDMVNEAMQGSNISNFATGNESGDVHSGGAPVTFRGTQGERFVRENPDVKGAFDNIPMAKAVGKDQPTPPAPAEPPDYNATHPSPTEIPAGVPDTLNPADEAMLMKQFEQEHPRVTGAVKAVIPSSLEQVKSMFTLPRPGDVEGQNTASEQWGQAVRGELGPEEQTKALTGTALAALPLTHLPFAESPFARASAAAEAITKARAAETAKIPPPVQPVPLDEAIVQRNLQAGTEQGPVEITPKEAPPSPQAAAEADVLAGRTGQPVRGTAEAQAAAEQAIRRGEPAPTLREPAAELPPNEEEGLPTAPGETPDLANVGLDLGKKKNGINPTQVVAAIEDEGGTVAHNEVSTKGPEDTLIVKATGMTPDAWDNVAARLGQDAIPVEHPDGTQTFYGKNEGGYKWDESQFQRPKTPTSPVESPEGAPAPTTPPAGETQAGGEPESGVGIAARYSQEAQPGEISEPGAGLNFGRKYLADGGDPELPIRRAQRTGLVGPNEVGIVRARYEQLVQLKRQAAREAEIQAGNPAAQAKLAAAEKAMADWRQKAQPIFTKWAEAGHEMQGETLPADLGTYNGIQELADQVHEGKKIFNPKERVRMRRAAEGVSKVQAKAAQAGEDGGLIDQIVKKQKAKKIMSLDELRDDLGGALKEQFSNCFT